MFDQSTTCCSEGREEHPVPPSADGAAWPCIICSRYHPTILPSQIGTQNRPDRPCQPCIIGPSRKGDASRPQASDPDRRATSRCCRASVHQALRPRTADHRRVETHFRAAQWPWPSSIGTEPSPISRHRIAVHNRGAATPHPCLRPPPIIPPQMRLAQIQRPISPSWRQAGLVLAFRQDA